MKFIKYILEDKLDFKNKKRVTIEKSMIELGLKKIDDNLDYLLNMNFLSLSNEKLRDLKNTYENKKSEIDVIQNISINKMWLTDLQNVKKLL